MNSEKERIVENNKTQLWYKWGPYISEREWGTVREDYSPDGKVWEYSTHEMARSKAYRWGEEGIGGICDEKQILCFALAMWNTKDKILKERLFGLNGDEGNHGEDVKECYYYLDNTPTHSYMKMLYKYPQNEFPYERLLSENKNRSKLDPEFELVNTGIFNENKYFDVFIEYAKNNIEDILIKITIANRGNTDAPINIIPQLWFRNSWSWGNDDYVPILKLDSNNSINVEHKEFGNYYFYFEDNPEALFCDNNINIKKLYNAENASGYFKDGINDYIINGVKNAVNTGKSGTKAGLNYFLYIPANKEIILRFRLTNGNHNAPFNEFDEIFSNRKNEADNYYDELQKNIISPDEKNIQRQAIAGLLWSKQFYNYDVLKWLNGDPAEPPPPKERLKGRNSDWFHLNNEEIISMPDKWEYPWYAAWDLSFHCVALAAVDCHFAKEQLKLLTRVWYMHPNGQFPAYEWDFSDVNPPVHAWATLKVYNLDKINNGGKGDTNFLETVFLKLLINFTWWVNRKDAFNLNIFQGGFLGLDNIGVFDRSSQLPTGGYLEQADATSWMAMYSLNMMSISLELALTNPVYQDAATKFLEHFLYIAGAMTNMGGMGVDMWDEEDEFFYDVINTPDNRKIKLKIRSIVGLIPLFAVEVIDDEIIKNTSHFKLRMDWFLKHRPDLARLVSRWHIEGSDESRLFSLLRGHRMKRLLKRMLDTTEFLSDYGVRALSKSYKDNPYIFKSDGQSFQINYEPGESESGLFGGNSNWRGPIWFPINFLIIESLNKFYKYYGDDFKVECPTNSGKYLNLKEIANEIANRLKKIFLRNDSGNRPVFGNENKFQQDENFSDHLLFYECFHGDTGRGVGASHQTGWTGLITQILNM